MTDSILIPINKKFLDVFVGFMDDNQKNKTRANNVRQYFEGIIDLLLKDKILIKLKPSEKYENINWKRKLCIIRKYDEEIGKNVILYLILVVMAHILMVK